jgi:V/A-type H+-transporting ATPase subunit A
MQTLQKEAELQEVVQMVGSDSLPDEQKVTLEVAKMIREIYLQQNAYHPVDCYCPLPRQYKMMSLIKKYSDMSEKALAAGVTVDKISSLPVRLRFAQAKYEENTDAEFDAVEKDMDAQFGTLGV